MMNPFRIYSHVPYGVRDLIDTHLDAHIYRTLHQPNYQRMVDSVEFLIHDFAHTFEGFEDQNEFSPLLPPPAWEETVWLEYLFDFDALTWERAVSKSHKNETFGEGSRIYSGGGKYPRYDKKSIIL